VSWEGVQKHTAHGASSACRKSLVVISTSLPGTRLGVVPLDMRITQIVAHGRRWRSLCSHANTELLEPTGLAYQAEHTCCADTHNNSLSTHRHTLFAARCRRNKCVGGMQFAVTAAVSAVCRPQQPCRAASVCTARACVIPRIQTTSVLCHQSEIQLDPIKSAAAGSAAA
jgi:hypothetical protein